MKNIKAKAPKEQNKDIIISVRLTAAQYAAIKKLAEQCGLQVSVFIREVALGYEPPQPMTDGQEKALMSLAAARSELTGIHNALQGRTQEERRRLFKSDRFMLVWMDGVNALTSLRCITSARVCPRWGCGARWNCTSTATATSMHGSPSTSRPSPSRFPQPWRRARTGAWRTGAGSVGSSSMNLTR
ncbi:MAG: hypothetical protein IJ618_05340 [Prevotella sp.]|nr:hypothetical protein [Prevotella sp.]